MFGDCQTFIGTGIDKWKLDSIQNIQNMFSGCKKLDVKLNKWKITSKVSLSRDIFKDCDCMKGKIPLWYYKN